MGALSDLSAPGPRDITMSDIADDLYNLVQKQKEKQEKEKQKEKKDKKTSLWEWFKIW